MLVRACAFALIFTAQAYAAEDGLRHDFRDKAGQIFCNPTAAQATAYWQAGIFDAQISGRLITPVTNKPLTETALRDESLNLERSRYHNGHAWGVCPNGSGWAVSMPASAPLTKVNASIYTLAKQPLQKHCQSYRLDYAEGDGAQTRELRLPTNPSSSGEIRINTSPLKAGTISLTCTPKLPTWQGPTMWYLAPVGNGPPVSTPFAEILKGANLDESLRTWVNALRKKYGFAELSINHPGLKAASDTLAKRFEIIHDRGILQKVKGDLAKHKIFLIGENRAQGKSVAELIWLLWNSPRHRSLMLSKRANAIAFTTQQKDDQVLAVMVLGRSGS